MKNRIRKFRITGPALLLLSAVSLSGTAQIPAAEHSVPGASVGSVAASARSGTGAGALDESQSVSTGQSPAILLERVSVQLEYQLDTSLSPPMEVEGGDQSQSQVARIER